MAEDIGTRPLPNYSPDKLREIGMIDPKPGERPKPTGSLHFEVRDDQIVSVEVPENIEMNIIVKPFAKVDSEIGEALLSTGAIKA